MRFRASLKNTSVFTKLTASLSSLGKICWMRVEQDVVRFTIIPERGTQVWSQIPVDTIFEEEDYQCIAQGDGINIEINVGMLNRILRSAIGSTSAQLRLTKKEKQPFLALSVLTSYWSDGKPVDRASTVDVTGEERVRDRETWVTHDMPVKILHPSAVENLHEPRCPDPDVHIILPGLAQLKNISDRFTRIASSSAKGSQVGLVAVDAPSTAGGAGAAALSASDVPKLELSANMHGKLRLSISTDELKIASAWSGLVNPPLDPAHINHDEYSQLPSTRMREIGEDDESGWARVRIDPRDWGRVLSVGRLSPRVVACFVNEMALVLYVYLPGSDQESCMTYYINSFTT
ncbi:hypothetical protein N7520_003526 [Penicillium odoratum]|uniref:uncharacterized protein n=1 Tax=Penicillium odoratum TaxID=1167516 RepID=UPI002547FBDF|nr:uncharacterized protein N7520_003526 [Penicillium odoratum]KAJ5768967.1 hypothetical protein N7520_003526 [Penicillium odoratum]